MRESALWLNFFFKFLHRNGSVIIDFVVHFNTTGNATLLTKAEDVLKQSLNQSNNGSSFAGFDVDRNQTFLQGKRVGECFINGMGGRGYYLIYR